MLKRTAIRKKSKNVIPALLDEAQRVFNEYIRLRDQEDGMFRCVSCDKFLSVKYINASHYMSAGLHSATRFDEENVFSSCVHCNQFMSGNLLEYRQRLIEKIGLEKVETLEIRAKMACKLDRYTLADIIERYQEKVKQLKEQHKHNSCG